MQPDTNSAIAVAIGTAIAAIVVAIGAACVAFVPVCMSLIAAYLTYLKTADENEDNKILRELDIARETRERIAKELTDKIVTKEPQAIPVVVVNPESKPIPVDDIDAKK